MRVMSIGLRLGECMILSAGWYNLMDLAACLPRSAERLDTRYQWIKRLLANARVVSDAVMAPYGREVLTRLSARHQRIILLIDQTQGERAPSGRHGRSPPRRPGSAASLAGVRSNKVSVETPAPITFLIICSATAAKALSMSSTACSGRGRPVIAA